MHFKMIAVSLSMISSLMFVPRVAEAAGALDTTAVVANVSGNLHGVEIGSLLADGRFMVRTVDGKRADVKLTSAVKTELFKKAAELSDADVRETSSMAVCSMVAPPALGNLRVSGYDATTGEFNSAKRLVLTEQDCTVANKAVPTDDAMKLIAYELRASLAILALDAAKNARAPRAPTGPGQPVPMR